jgi:hypothetical protein
MSYKELIKYVDKEPKKTRFPPDPVLEIWEGIKLKRYLKNKELERSQGMISVERINKSKQMLKYNI